MEEKKVFPPVNSGRNDSLQILSNPSSPDLSYSTGTTKKGVKEVLPDMVKVVLDAERIGGSERERRKAIFRCGKKNGYQSPIDTGMWELLYSARRIQELKVSRRGLPPAEKVRDLQVVGTSKIIIIKKKLRSLQSVVKGLLHGRKKTKKGEDKNGQIEEGGTQQEESVLDEVVEGGTARARQEQDGASTQQDEHEDVVAEGGESDLRRDAEADVLREQVCGQSGREGTDNNNMKHGICRGLTVEHAGAAPSEESSTHEEDSIPKKNKDTSSLHSESSWSRTGTGQTPATSSTSETGHPAVQPQLHPHTTRTRGPAPQDLASGSYAALRLGPAMTPASLRPPSLPVQQRRAAGPSTGPSAGPRASVPIKSFDLLGSAFPAAENGISFFSNVGSTSPADSAFAAAYHASSSGRAAAAAGQELLDRSSARSSILSSDRDQPKISDHLLGDSLIQLDVDHNKLHSSSTARSTSSSGRSFDISTTGAMMMSSSKSTSRGSKLLRNVARHISQQQQVGIPATGSKMNSEMIAGRQLQEPPAQQNNRTAVRQQNFTFEL